MKDLKKGQWVTVRGTCKGGHSFQENGLVVFLMKVAGEHAAGVWLLEFPDGTPAGLPFADSSVTPAPKCFEPIGIEKGPMVAYILCSSCKKTPLPPWQEVGDNCTSCELKN